MRIFDRVHTENIERRELQLTVLAGVAIIVLATGLAALMYPTVFSNQLLVTGRKLRVAFFGFCTLSVLLVGYLLDRQLTIRRLRRQLLAELQRNLELRREASADLLNSLPGLADFQDRLAMEYRRSASAQRVLSLLVIILKPSGSLTDSNEVTAAFGDAAKSMSRKLQEKDSIYLFCPGFFGIMLPGADTKSAQRLAEQVSGGLQDAAGAASRFTFETRVFNYPEHAGSSSELEQAVYGLLPEHHPGLLAVGGHVQ